MDAARRLRAAHLVEVYLPAGDGSGPAGAAAVELVGRLGHSLAGAPVTGAPRLVCATYLADEELLLLTFTSGAARQLAALLAQVGIAPLRITPCLRIQPQRRPHASPASVATRPA